MGCDPSGVESGVPRSKSENDWGTVILFVQILHLLH